MQSEHDYRVFGVSNDLPVETIHEYGASLRSSDIEVDPESGGE
jgi:hypothetical protein